MLLSQSCFLVRLQKVKHFHLLNVRRAVCKVKAVVDVHTVKSNRLIIEFLSRREKCFLYLQAPEFL